MRCDRRAVWTAAGVAGALVVFALAPAGPGASALEAQESAILPPPQLVAVGGVFQRDQFHGDGASTLLGFRARLPLSGWLVVEPGMLYTSFTPDTTGLPDASGENVELMLVDFQFQIQHPVDVLGPDRLRPWLGLGIGGGADFRDDRGTSDFLVGTLSASAGASFDVGARISVLAEARLRLLDEADRRNVDLVLGIGWSP